MTGIVSKMSRKIAITRLIACSFILSLTAYLMLFPESATAAPNSPVDGEFINKIWTVFYEKSSAWASTLQNYALGLFKLLLIFEVCWLGIKAALGRTPINEILSQFCMMLIFAGFMLAVINYYPEWSQNIINGLTKISGDLGGGKVTDTPFRVGMEIVKKVFDNLSIWDPGNSIALIVAALVVMTCFALITAQVVFVKCESYIAMNACILLLGFGGTSILKDYAVNAMRYALSVAFKLFVLQLLLGVGMSFITDLEAATADFKDIFVVIGASIVLLALTKSIPDVCAGIITGSHVSSGMALGGAVTSVMAGTAGAAIGMAGGAANSVQNVKDAANIANLAGKTGLGKAASMAGSLAGGFKDAYAPSGGSMRTAMQERLGQAVAKSMEPK